MLRVIRSRIFTSLQTAVKYLDIPESCFSTLVSRETLSANLIDFVLEGRENIPIWQKLTWFVCSYCGSHQIKMILILLCFLGEWSATLQGEWPRTSSPPGPAWKPHLSRLSSPRFSSTEEWGKRNNHKPINTKRWIKTFFSGLELLKIENVILSWFFCLKRWRFFV